MRYGLRPECSEMDNPDNLDVLPERGKAAAGKKILASDFLSTFDLAN